MAAEKRELEDLAALMMELEEAEEVGDAEGEGDLLDDFVLVATQAGEEEEGEEEGGELGGAGAAAAAAAAAAGGLAAGGVSTSGDDSASVSSLGESFASSDEVDTDDDGGSGGAAGSRGQANEAGSKPPPRPGSIASTYWREERHDRKNLLTVIDEK